MGQRGFRLAGLAGSVAILAMAGTGIQAAGVHRVSSSGLTMNVALTTALDTFDPTVNSTAWFLNFSLYSYLIGINDRGRYFPDLASAMPTTTDNGLVYTFHLRKARFWNGNPVTAQDVVWSLNRTANPKTGSWAVGFMNSIAGFSTFEAGHAKSLSGITAPNASTVVIRLRARDSALLGELAAGPMAILDPRQVDKYGSNYGLHPMGSGPYQVQSYLQGQRLVLTRNPYYYLKGAGGQRLPYVGRVVINLSVNPAVAALQIEKGQTDLLAGTLPKASYYTAILNRQYKGLVSRSLAWYTYQIALNTSVKPFNNLKVREAVALAVNRGQIAKALGPYWVMPTVQRLPKGFPGYANDFPYPKPNQAKAKRLLTEAGFPHGFTTTYVVGNWPDVANDTALAQVLQSQLARIGIRLKIKVEGPSEVATAVNTKGETPMFTVWWGADFPDPYDFLNAQFGCNDFPPHGDNQMFWCDPKVDQLDNQALTELNRPKELSLYLQSEKIIQANFVYVPLFQTYTVTMHSARLTNFSVNPIYQWDFAEYRLK